MENENKIPTLTRGECGDYLILDSRLLPEWSGATTPEGAWREYLGLCKVKNLPPAPVIRCGSKVVFDLWVGCEDCSTCRFKKEPKH